MKRIDALEIIASKCRDALIICNIGFPCRELCSVGDRPETFYMLGSMGMSSSIGLGGAVAAPHKKVISIDGDGAILMNLGSLATIGSLNLDNYVLIILDNGAYGSTGSQPTSLSRNGSLSKIAIGAGVSCVLEVQEKEELSAALNNIKKGVIVVKIETGNSKAPLVPYSPEEIKKNFMAAVSRPVQ